VVVRNHIDSVGLAGCEGVHDDLVSVIVRAVGYRAFEVLEIVCDFIGEDLKSLSLYRKHAGVDPIPLWGDRLRKAEELRLRFTRLKAALVRHELVRVDERDVRDEQWRQISFCEK